jgi:DNA-binding NarL/FixJ family response regulator
MNRKDQPQAGARIRVMLVDDHLSILWGLERLLGGEKNMEVAGKATSARKALETLEEVRPDVVLLDLDLGGESGVELIPRILEKSSARVVVLTGVRDAGTRDQAVFAGARGIVGKEEPPENILKAVEKVHAGELWLDRSATGRIFVEFSRRLTGGSASEAEQRIGLLTARELEIVRLLTREPETSIAAIAKKVHTSEHTLRNHLTSIYNKLGVTGRLQLHVFAAKHRLG